ncbi:MAG TPA: SurA N-terminal domain-containing protein [Allosphingosinicella sp.]|nr:SurA N-terminal domain-containing protein [Allosphingosinicella sp.]
MLTFFRRGVMSKVMLGVLFLSLVAIVITGFGTGGMGGLEGLSGLGSSTVAKAGGEAITSEELRDNVQRQLERIRQQQPELDIGQFVRRGGVDEVLEQMISAAATMDFANSVGIVASKKMVDAQIAAIPGFQNAAGKFDQNIFLGALQRERITEDQLRKEIATRLIERQVALPAGGSASVPQALAAQYASLLLEARSGTLGAVPSAAMGGGNEPTDQEIADFYRKNVGRYTIPERRVIRYAVFGTDTLGAAAKASDAEIEAAYNRDQASYGPRETRILSQVVLTSDAAAKAFQQKLAAGTPFPQAAQQAGFGAADIALGAKTKAEVAKLSSDAVANAVFAAQKGAVVGPIRDPLGWHIVKVDDVKAVAGKPLAAVRGEIASRLEAQKGQALLSELAARIESKVSEGASFDQVVRDEKLAIVQTPAVTAAGGAPDAQDWKVPPEFAAVLKGASLLGANEPPQLAQVIPNQKYALVSVSQVIAAAPPPFAKIQAQVKGDLVAQRAGERAKAVAQSIVSKINAGVAPAEAFRQANVALPPLQPLKAVRRDIAKQGQQVPPQLQTLFTLPRGKARMIPAAQNLGWLIVYLDTVVPGDAGKEPGLIQAVRSQFTSVVGDEYAQQLVGAIRGGVKIQRNQTALAKLKGELAGNRPTS